MSTEDERTEPVAPPPPGGEGSFVLGGRALRPGDPVGAFVFEQEIGSGGTARVLLARDAQGRRVALKVLRGTASPATLERFRREFHVLSRLRHPNIVEVFGAGELDGHPYIALEYVDGPDLHQLLHEIRDLDPAARWARVERVVVELCRALSALHRRGLVHRDLKPTNVLITREGVAKLTDFGIVKDLGGEADGHASTTLVGTWAYASPEHLAGLPVDHRADLYSLGVLLFVLLTGRRPFQASDLAGYLEVHREHVVPRPSAIAPGVPPVLDEVCARLLAKAPRDRFQSAQEVLYRLEASDAGDVGAEGDASWEPPLVGRPEVVAAIGDAVSALTRGQGAVVRVIGPDGSGRSRLLQVAVAQAWALGVPVHDHALRDEAGLWSLCVQLVGDLAKELSPADHARLEPTLRAAVGDGRPRPESRYALPEALVGALETLTADRPRVLVFDDFHHAGATKGEVLRQVARRTVGAGLPVLLLVAGRPDSEVTDPGWRHGLHPVDLVLDPLREADVEALLGLLVGAVPGRDRLAARLHAESEGNPAFVTELLRSLAAQGLLVRKGSGWRLTVHAGELAHGAIEIPSTLRALLRGRVARLAADERALLDALAVSGDAVSVGVLADVLDLDEEELLRRIDRLLRSGLVREERAVDDLRLGLIHGKLGEVLRLDLAPARARALHRAFAVALGATRRRDVGTLVAIGDHARLAGDAGRAYEHLVAAASTLADAQAGPDASALLERAASVEAAARQELPAGTWNVVRRDHLVAVGACAKVRGAWSDAVAAYEALRTHAVAIDDPRAALDAALGLASCARATGNAAVARAEAGTALAGARRLQARPLVAEALLVLTGAAWSAGDLVAADASLQEGLLVAQTPDLASRRAQLLVWRARVQAALGQLAVATKAAHEAEVLLRELRLEPLRAATLARLAELLTWQGDGEAALARARDAVALARRIDARPVLAGALRILGKASLDVGRVWDAHDALHESAEVARSIEPPAELLGALTLQLRLAVEQGDRAGALRYAAAAARPGLPDGDRFGPWRDALAARALAGSRPEAALALVEAAEATLASLHVPRRFQVLLAAAEARIALGDRERAATLASELLAHPASSAFRMISIEARALLVEVSRADEAVRHQRAALEALRELFPGAANLAVVRRRSRLRALATAPDAS